MRGMLAFLAVMLAGCIWLDDGSDDCGNGVLDKDEECDDGNRDDCDGCGAGCTLEQALVFDEGTHGASVTAENVPCLSCPFTIEAWFKFDGPSVLTGLYEIPEFITCEVGTERHDVQSLYGGTYGEWPHGSLAPGTWHHFAVSCWYEGDEWFQSYFLDGQENFGGTSSVGEHTWPCDSGMSIGIVSPSGVSAAIDDLRISSESLYTWHDAPFSPRRRLQVRQDTIALWNFNTETGGVIPDASGNGRDAVLVDGHLAPDECHRP